jgi:DNA-binding transcriptional ArsR family regulator
MLETHYRASRFCRVLGNPTAYQILKLLEKSKKTPTKLAKDLNLSLKTTSATLRHMRQINLVRYTTASNRKIYFLKDQTLTKVLKNIENFVDTMRVAKW